MKKLKSGLWDPVRNQMTVRKLEHHFLLYSVSIAATVPAVQAKAGDSKAARHA
jgi:hypothetical protein